MLIFKYRFMFVITLSQTHSYARLMKFLDDWLINQADIINMQRILSFGDVTMEIDVRLTI